MISMLYFELKLIRIRKIEAMLLFLPPIILLLTFFFEVNFDLFFAQLIPFVIGWRLIGSTIIYMKRYRQFEALFSLSVAPKDIFLSNLIALGIYYICIFFICLPLYLTGIPILSMTEFMSLFALVFLLLGAKLSIPHQI